MGFFSWDCKRCGHPMLSKMAATEDNDWMSQVVVMEANGNRLMGEYDGYGRVGYADIDIDFYGGEPCCYHHDCWVAEGKPEYDGPSRYSHDQGFFFDDDVHNIESPL